MRRVLALVLLSAWFVFPVVPARAARRASGPKPPRWPTIDLFALNRHETMKLRIADDRGRPIKGVQKRMDQFLRCHHTNVVFRMSPRLTRLIYETGRHYPSHRIEVVSGYRHPSVARNPRSPHKLGLACDFRVVGVKNTELRDFLRRTFAHVGVGYYPNSSFVHLDVRTGPSAFWIDYSGPGQAAVYADKPMLDLKTGRADRYHPESASTQPGGQDDGDEAEARADLPSTTGASDMPSPPAESVPPLTPPASSGTARRAAPR